MWFGNIREALELASKKATLGLTPESADSGSQPGQLHGHSQWNGSVLRRGAI